MNSKIRLFIIKYARIGVLLVLFVFFSLTTKTFFSFGNLNNIRNILLFQWPMLMVMAASTLLIITVKGGIDLTIGSTAGLTTVVVGLLMVSTNNTALSVLAGLAVGLIIGMINALLVSYIQVPVYIVTYCMMWVTRGVTLLLIGGNSVYQYTPSFVAFFKSTPYVYLGIAGFVLVILYIALGMTTLGRKIYAIGNNEEAAIISGVKTKRIVAVTMAVSGVIASIVGIMYMSLLNGGDASLGSDFALKSISAALIGGASISGGNGRISNAVIGSLIIVVLNSGMIHIGVPTVWQDVTIGMVIILSVAFDRLINFGKERGKYWLAGTHNAVCGPQGSRE